MVTNETWMGSGTSITMAPESELFLGYMPYGPTLGRTGTNKAHLIKYSLGYAVDGANVIIENAHGHGSKTVGHFTDYYALVPDLYTGCIAKFYYADSTADATLRFTAIVAGNDADAIYFAGNLTDFPTLHSSAAALDGDNTRGYIVLSKQGSIVPAPLSFEERASTTGAGIVAFASGERYITNAANTGTVATIKSGDILYENDGRIVGKVFSCDVGGTGGVTFTDASATSTRIHTISEDMGRSHHGGAGATAAADGIIYLFVDNMTGSRTSLAGVFTAGDYISYDDDDSDTTIAILGKVITMNADGTLITVAQHGSADTADNDYIYWGAALSPNAHTVGEPTLYTAYPRILSDNWVGLTNTITPPNTDVEMKQLGLAMMGSRNFTYQYKGMETASNASIDANLNHGTWLHYAFGSTALTKPGVSGTDNVNTFLHAGTEASKTSATGHETWVSMASGDAVAGVDSGPFFHRVLKGTSGLCPPVLPGYTAEKLSNNPSMSDAGVAENTFTYTFSERNDSTLPSFALELVQQKGSKLANAPMVDRNTYNEECYAQVYPGCTVNSFTLSANENEEVKATLDLNVKRVFEAPDGYMGRCYDATNNKTNDFKNLYNFGQITGDGGTNTSGTVVKEFMTPFFFSDGTISLFGQEFMKVSTFSLSVNNSVTDKRYIGNYDKQIKMSVPGQRTYEITMSALVTDRRMFDELRKEESTRSVISSDSVIQLLLSKDNGEQIKLQFDDFMVSTNSWPVPEDKGPVYVDFTIVPLATQTISAISHWVMQG